MAVFRRKVSKGQARPFKGRLKNDSPEFVNERTGIDSPIPLKSKRKKPKI